MNLEEAEKRIKKLREKINELNYKYFVLDESEVEESVRDSLKRELIDLEAIFPELITSDSPTQRVGSVLSGRFEKIKHKTPKKFADVLAAMPNVGQDTDFNRVQDESSDDVFT